MLRKVGPRTVVSLIDDAERLDPSKPEFAAEEAMLRERPGVRLERIPVELGGWPDDAAIQRFLSITTDPSSQPVLVHCAQGVRRTGFMVAAYQMSELGWSKERAKQELLTFGHSMRTVGDVQRFIDAYDPASRKMTQTLPRSKE
jgi:protein-tyrosine phosphatase